MNLQIGNSTSDFSSPVKLAYDIIYLYNPRQYTESYTQRELTDEEEKTNKLAHRLLRKVLKEATTNPTNKVIVPQNQTEDQLIVGVNV